MYVFIWIRCNTDIPCRSVMGSSIVKNLKILVEETVRSTTVGTSRISQYIYTYLYCVYKTLVYDCNNIAVRAHLPLLLNLVAEYVRRHII
jgi:hypothetical protein